MINKEIEQFMSAGNQLADLNNLQAHPGRRQQRHDATQIRTIIIDRMLAQIAIVPMDVDHIDVVAYDGDAQMLAAVTGTVTGDVLRLRGELPFKPGSSRSNSFNGGVNVSGGSVFISGGRYGSINIGGGDMYVNGNRVSGGGDVLLVDGREIDLTRAIQLALIVPPTVNITIDGHIGAVGISGDLDSSLDFHPSIRTELVGQYVGSLSGDITGSGRVTLAGVRGDAELEIAGSGSFSLGSVDGAIDARISGSGNVTVAGGSSRALHGSVSGSGRIDHRGTVRESARLRVSGSGSITTSTVTGAAVDQRITGSGCITVNGRTQRPRW